MLCVYKISGIILVTRAPGSTLRRNPGYPGLPTLSWQKVLNHFFWEGSVAQSPHGCSPPHLPPACLYVCMTKSHSPLGVERAGKWLAD